jgi:histidine triad (HIT) family protein
VFCRIRDRRAPASIVYEDVRVLAFMDIRPIRRGQLLVIPKEHIDEFADLSEDLANAVLHVGQRLARTLRRLLAPQRVGFIVHGFGVPHAHLVVVPLEHPWDITAAQFAVIEEDRLSFRWDAVPLAEPADLEDLAVQLQNELGREERTRTELDDLIEHMERYRAVTLQAVDMIAEEDMAWRPGAGHYSLGQQLLHIAQTEDLYTHGLFEEDWNFERARFPRSLPALAELRALFTRVREKTRLHLARLGAEDLARTITIPGSDLELTLRSWLWFVLEHEIHHKGQVWSYLRQMGRTPPFYAMPLPERDRPDILARENLGGF